MVSAKGAPRWSVKTCLLVPNLPRSVGLGPVCAPPRRFHGHAVQGLEPPLDAPQVVISRQQLRPQLLEYSRALPLLEALVASGAGAELLGHRFPLATGAQDVQDAVHDLAKGRRGTPRGARRMYAQIIANLGAAPAPQVGTRLMQLIAPPDFVAVAGWEYARPSAQADFDTPTPPQPEWQAQHAGEAPPAMTWQKLAKGGRARVRPARAGRRMVGPLGGQLFPRNLHLAARGDGCDSMPPQWQRQNRHLVQRCAGAPVHGRRVPLALGTRALRIGARGAQRSPGQDSRPGAV